MSDRTLRSSLRAFTEDPSPENQSTYLAAHSRTHGFYPPALRPPSLRDIYLDSLSVLERVEVLSRLIFLHTHRLPNHNGRVYPPAVIEAAVRYAGSLRRSQEPFVQIERGVGTVTRDEVSFDE